jgi:hypothetical protein
VLGLSLNELDSLPEAMRVPEKGGLQIDSVTVAFGQDYLLLQDLATIFLIKQNLGKRPIYFSLSDGGYPDQTLGLSAYLVGQGMVRKLLPKPVAANDSIVLSAGLGYVDLPRTRRLLWRSTIGRRPRATGHSDGWTHRPVQFSRCTRLSTRGRRTLCGRRATPPSRPGPIQWRERCRRR